MAPEQAAGSKEVGPAADVWALGAILYECLTGRTPFKGKDWLETLQQVRFQDPIPPRRLRRTVPRDLETVCLKCLEKDPRKRYASAAELAGRMRLVLDNKPIPDRQRGWPAKAWQALRSHPRLCTGVALLALLAATLLWGTRAPRGQEGGDRRDPERPRQEAEDLLAQGQRYEFQGHEPLPGPFRWVLGDAGVPQANPSDKSFTVQTWGVALLELVADPQCESYRFAADVRHDMGTGNSLAGIYFGYRDHRTPSGKRQQGFFLLDFADSGLVARHRRGKNGEDLSRVLMECWVCEPLDGRVIPLGTNIPSPLTFPPALPAGDRPACWRRLEVQVTPQGVEAWWEPEPGRRRPVVRQTAGDLASTMAHTSRLGPGFGDLPTGFRPRSGLGLYIDKAKVSFRHIVLEPLVRGQ
jgi:hypothetical protein